MLLLGGCPRVFAVTFQMATGGNPHMGTAQAHNSEIYRKSFQLSGARNWNQMPDAIKTMPPNLPTYTTLVRCLVAIAIIIFFWYTQSVLFFSCFFFMVSCFFFNVCVLYTSCSLFFSVAIYLRAPLPFALLCMYCRYYPVKAGPPGIQR